MSSSKKILLVSKYFFPAVGGIESVVHQHALYLIQAGYDVSVLCFNHSRSFRTYTEIIDNIPIIRIPSFGDVFSLPVAPSIFYKLHYLVRQYDLVIVHLPNPLVTLSCFLLSSQTTLIVFWHSDIVRQRKIKKIIEPFQKRLCHRASKIFTTSENLAQFSSVISEFSHKTSIIPLSVSSPNISNNNQIDNFSININVYKPYALFLGRLCHYKGINILLESISLLNIDKYNFSIIIAGDGPLSKRIHNWMNSNLFYNILFLNRKIDDTEKEILLSNAAFLLFPSTASNEAFGLIQLEAMRYGVPVINTNLKTGVPYVSLHEITGLTVPPNDSFALYKAIKRLIYNPAERKQFGLKSKKRVDHYFSNELIKKIFIDEINYLFL